MLNDTHYFTNQISLNLTENYYWTDDWNEEFYIALARAGFISTSYDTKGGLVLLPELQFDYAVLDFVDLHIPKSVKNIMKLNNYKFAISSKFYEVLEQFSIHHKDNWLKEEYLELLKKIYINEKRRSDFKLISVEVIDKESEELIAGEVGYIIGKTYTSLSGFSSKEKRYSNYGTLQLVLLAQYLQSEGFMFWNLGHPHMSYKKRLGCKIYSRSEFLNRWKEAILLPI